MGALRFVSVPGCFRHIRALLQIFAPISWVILLVILLTVTLYGTNDDPWHWSLSATSRHGHEVTEQDQMMAELGFVPNPILYPNSHHQVEDLPVFVAAIRSEDLHSFHRFLGSFRLHFRQRKLVVYDLGLSSKEIKLVRHTCQCLVRAVHWDRYPPHVKDTKLKAYRPILIQETLREFGIVFWCNHQMRFNGSRVDQLRARAEAVGLITWPSQRYPTSTYTHDAMLERFGVKRHSVHFQHMADPESALFVNTYRLHEYLMKPWVRCALDVDCLAPFGAQSESCDLTREPRFRFSGCHRYDASAFNVLLGKMFHYDDRTYILSDVMFNRELVLPPVRRHRTASTVKPSASRRSSLLSSQWEIQNTDDDRQPILYKRKRPLTT